MSRKRLLAMSLLAFGIVGISFIKLRNIETRPPAFSSGVDSFGIEMVEPRPSLGPFELRRLRSAWVTRARKILLSPHGNPVNRPVGRGVYASGAIISSFVVVQRSGGATDLLKVACALPSENMKWDTTWELRWPRTAEHRCLLRVDLVEPDCWLVANGKAYWSDTWIAVPRHQQVLQGIREAIGSHLNMRLDRIEVAYDPPRSTPAPPLSSVPPIPGEVSPRAAALSKRTRVTRSRRVEFARSR